MKTRAPILTILSYLACAGGSKNTPATPTKPPVEPLPETGQTAASAPTIAPRSDSTLIARELLFGNPERVAPRLSPDGQKLAFLAPVKGVMNVWEGPADDIQAAKPITRETNRGLRQFFWARTSRHVLYLQDKDGDENFHVHVVDLGTGAIQDLTPYPNTKAQVVHLSDRFPETILVGLNDRDAKHHDVYRLDIRSAHRTLVLKNEAGFLSFVADDAYQVRYGLRMLPDGGSEYVDPRAPRDAKPFLAVPREDSLTTEPVGFDASGRILYLRDSRNRNTAALFEMNPRSGKTKLLFENPSADVEGETVHPKTKRIQAVNSTYERRNWKVLDNALTKDFAYLRTVIKGDLYIHSRSQDDRRWIVADSVSDGPTRYFLYDRNKKHAALLFTDRPALEQVPLATMHPTIIESRDGLPLVSYLTLPRASDADGDGRPDRPQPTVLLVHGGPWARDYWGFHGFHQWLANRGYAVLSVNFRGSTGFGKKFTNAGDKQWGATMHNDLIDAVEWAVSQKISDPKKTAIMGPSYGGYATLVGLTFTPDRFACGVDIVGPSSLLTLLNSIPPYWAPMLELLATRVGDPRTEEGKRLLIERSPLTHVDEIKKPLLIGQGANDPRVKQAESDQIVKAMQRRNIPVTYVLYPDEGHGFVRPENRLSFNAVAEIFLAQCLGGPYEPIGDDFSGSTIKIPSGAEQVHGLKSSLQLGP